MIGKHVGKVLIKGGNIMKNSKLFKYKFLFFIIMICFMILPTNSINAETLDDEYGIFCEYGDYWFLIHKELMNGVYHVENNFDILNIDIPADSSKWSGMGIVVTSGNNQVFTCPSNPFGTNLGNPTDQALGKNNGIFNAVEPDSVVVDNSYSCVYVGQKTKKTISITYHSDNEVWSITYPDGTTIVNPRSIFYNKYGINLTYDDTCSSDLYYVSEQNIIKFSDISNSYPNSAYNATLGNLCQNYTDDQIEHFCSGDCLYKELVCQNSSIEWGQQVEKTCDGIIGKELLDFINKIFRWIQILAPIFVVIMGGIDFAGAILQDDKDSLKKASSKFIKRLIIAVALFFIPLILSFLLNVFNDITGANTDTCGIGVTQNE